MRGNYLEDLISSWGSLMRNVATRVQTASREVRDREYTASKMVSDVVGTWMEGVDAWMGMLRGEPAAGTPTVFFKFPQGRAVKSATVPDGLPPDVKIEVTDLVPMGTAFGRIPARNVKVERVDGQLSVRLIDLGGHGGQSVPP